MLKVPELAGKVAIVTGSSSGIGYRLAVGLAEQGVKVVVNSRKLERLEGVCREVESLGGEVLPVQADVRDPDQVAALVEQTLARFGTVHFLINNAGGTFWAPAEQISPNGWRAVVESNLTSAFLASRAVFPEMRKNGYGVIINVSSVAAFEPGSSVHYSAAKAGVIQLTQILAIEWGRYGIRVNCVVPGAIMTAASRFAKDPEFARRVAERVPLGRIGTPDDVLGPVLFLLSDAAAYVNGAALRIDGGLRGGL
ncbi:MAG: 2,4-dienoyl-CoA reductase [Chloroflexota bacterium]